jgi:hypothetical protein
MTTTHSKNKFFVNLDNRVTIVCPDCGKPTTVNVAQFRGKKYSLKVKCKCGHQFKIQLEFRRYQRKSTDLEGTYGYASDRLSNRVKVTDLSIDGARFETIVPHDLQVGQKGKLVFTLDDKKKTTLAKEVVIRSIKGNIVGCEFKDNQAYEKGLGFYLHN